MKILSVLGTRPEAIKMAPVIRELNKRSASGGLQSVACVTGQHREMLDQVLQLFDIRPDYDLNIMQKDQSLAQVTANVLTRLEPVIVKEKPDWVLVQGDTTTVMAAALIAFYHRVQIGHVEAGLRTWNKFHPFPEEINRKVADCICDLHFAPTEWSRQNLHYEGVDDASIRVTGNTVIDALHWVADQAPTPEVLALFRQLGIDEDGKGPKDNGRRTTQSNLLSPSSLIQTRFARLILVTAHRRENFGESLENICKALREIAARYDEVRIVYPVHLNPNVQRVAHSLLDGVPNISLLEPLEYLPLVHLMKRAYLVLTDSGGLQEEAPVFGVPVLVMRETTERPEAITAGTARLVGTDRGRIVDAVSCLMDDVETYGKMAHADNPFGDGRAAERIVSALMGEACTPFESPRGTQANVALQRGV